MLDLFCYTTPSSGLGVHEGTRAGPTGHPFIHPWDILGVGRQRDKDGGRKKERQEDPQVSYVRPGDLAPVEMLGKLVTSCASRRDKNTTLREQRTSPCSHPKVMPTSAAGYEQHHKQAG